MKRLQKSAIVGKNMKKFKYCCEIMEDMSTLSCVMHDKYECPDVLIDRHKDGKMGIIIHDDGTSMMVINYCPWCGSKINKRKKNKNVGRCIQL